MQVLITLGLVGFLAAIAGPLFYFIHTVLDYDDARRTDPVPPEQNDT